MTDNFNFALVGQEGAGFKGYISSVDPTNVEPEILVRGSKNVYKKLSGTIANRPGQLKFGAVDPTLAAVISSYEWDSSVGIQRPMRVANGKLQVESTIVDGSTPVWYTLLSGIPDGYAPGQSRFVMSPWWNDVQKRDVLAMVHGTSDLLYWGGGVTQIAAADTNVINMQGNNVLITTADISLNAGTRIQGMSNGINGIGAFIGIGFSAQPNAGDGGSLTINGTPVSFQFVTVLTGVAGQVLIDTTVAQTVSNFLDLLQNPSSTNTKHVAFSGSGSPSPQTLIGYFTSTRSFALTKLNTSTTWAQDGFYIDNLALNKNVVINGNTYTYITGENTIYLFGVTPDATGEPSGSVALQAVVTVGTTPTAGFNNDFISTIGNQLYVGSYTSRLIYISSDTNFLTYTVPTPRTPGDPELLTLDDAGRGIGISKGAAYISAGSKDWYIVTFQNITVGTDLTQQTLVDKRQTADLNAALAHEFIDSVGDDIVFLAQDQQVRYFGTFRNLETPKFPSLSQEIETELDEENFTGGALRAVADFIYITAPAAGRVYLRQTRTTVDDNGNVVAERLWHSPFIWNISRVAVINSIEYGHSNANPMIYQLWDTGQYHDDSPSGQPLQYACVARFAYRNNVKQRSNLVWFDKTYFEGYLSLGTELNAQVYFDYQGNSGIQNLVINSVASPAALFTAANAPSLGDSSLGDNSLGDGLNQAFDAQDALPKFRAICDINPIDCFETLIEVYSDSLDAQWELLCLGLNFTAPPNGELPTYLRKSA